MVQYRRNLLAGGTFFFTATLADRCSSALVENVELLRRAFRTARRERPFAVDAVVVLPDHLHIVMYLPVDDADFPGRWKRVKSLFTRYAVARGIVREPNKRGEYSLWQRRYWEHTVRDEGDFARHVDYIHYNPVKHGLVPRAGDWAYSSFRRYVKLRILPLDWGGSRGDFEGGFGERKG
jgi:putative transposase